MALYEMEDAKERVILVGVQENDAEPEEESLDELAELARTAGAEVAGRLIQKREAMHPVTYIGKGKILELKELLWETDATGIICDDELTSVQLNHLEEELECKIVDRTLLILDIFAGRAVSREGKIQVELAQLKYRAARLVGLRNSLSRLGGGIGTRGPGEKKLEMDRRLIRERISRLKKELREVEEHRERLRTQRKRSNLKVAALVGYTSAGKSSLENALTGAGVLEDAMLFSTLDTTTRSLRLADTQEILLSDTVGFIRKLPHHLVEAFKSTLEEAKYADIIDHMDDDIRVFHWKKRNTRISSSMWSMLPIRIRIPRCLLSMRHCVSSVRRENRSLPYSTNRINWKHRDISGIFMQSTQSRFPQRQGRGWKN